MTAPGGSDQLLRIGLAKLLHKLPDEIDGMTYEDALRLAIHSELEREEFEKKSASANVGSPGAGAARGGKVRTEKTVYKQRQRRK